MGIGDWAQSPIPPPQSKMITRGSKTPSVSSKGNSVNQSKRTKLLNLLLQKFQKKYPSADPSLVRNLVETIIKKPSITEKDLQEVEQKIKNQLQSEVIRPETSKSREVELIKDEARFEEDNISVMSRPCSAISSATPLIDKNAELLALYDRTFGKKPVERKAFGKNEWVEMNEAKLKLNEEIKRKEKQRLLEQKRAAREVFNKQVDEKKQAKRKEKEENKEYGQYVNEHVKHLTVQEKQKEMELAEKKRKEKEERERQIAENDKLKKIDKIQDRQLDWKMSIFLKS